MTSCMQYKNSPEIHDLVRFRDAIMNKYVQTHDAYFRDMANALTPQIEDKIREFNRSHNALNWCVLVLCERRL